MVILKCHLISFTDTTPRAKEGNSLNTAVWAHLPLCFFASCEQIVSCVFICFFGVHTRKWDCRFVWKFCLCQKDCYNRAPQMRKSINNRKVFFTVWRLGGPGSWCQHGQILVRALPQVGDYLLLTMCLHGGRNEGFLWGLFYKGLIPTHEGSTFMTQSPPNDLISSHHMGDKDQHMNGG